jgi:hypothetical protein
MNERKFYAVILTGDAIDELGKTFSVFVKNKENDSYITAKSVESDGNYFHMTVDQEILAGDKVELELQIPHEFIKAAVCGAEADIREMGFL